jgi:hypothetical protein
MIVARLFEARKASPSVSGTYVVVSGSVPPSAEVTLEIPP